MDELDRLTRSRLPPPVLYAGPALLAWGLDRAAPVALLPRHAGVWPGMILVALAAALFLSAAACMHRAGTSPEPWRPSTVLVTGGPFRFSRNPIYLAYTVGYAGFICLANTLWGVLFLPFPVIAVHFRFIAPEERYLARRFGDRYRAYAARVRRWL